MLAAGRLRQLITIRRLTDVSNGKGGYKRGWSTLAENLRAEVISQSGRESVIANTLQGISTYKITIRHREGLKVNDQVIWNGQELNILAPPSDPTGKRQETLIFADTNTPQRAGAPA